MSSKINKPRAGSLAYKPIKRAKKETPTIKNWPGKEEEGESKLLGFAGYKAGMTHIIAKDNRKNSRSSGLEVFMPVTILEVPPIVVAGLRAYSDGYFGKKAYIDVFSDNLSEDFKKRLNVRRTKKVTQKTKNKKGKDVKKEVFLKKEKKTIKDIEKEFENISDITLIVHTQPRLTSLSKKKSDVMEIALVGSVEDKLNFAKEKLGKEIAISEVFSENSVIDTVAVTKGKGYSGVIKRHGTIKQPEKFGKGRRHVGSGGSWTPRRKMWKEPLPGRLGYNTRTELNKLIVKLGNNPEEINPKGGFLNYGFVKGQYLMLKGSVTGPSKRLIRFTYPRRPISSNKVGNFEIEAISTESKQKA